MGMGYASNWANTIKADDIAKLCPKEYKAFNESFKANDIDLDTVVKAWQYSESLEDPKIDAAIRKAYSKLRSAFTERTMVGKKGLTLYLEYHNSEDEGSRYDDVSGVFWCVKDVHTYTPAGKKFAKYIKTSAWVTFG